MKLEETENLKLQYVKNIQTTTTQINKKHNSEIVLSKKITEILNIYPNFKGKPSIRKWCNYCRRYGHSTAECRQKQQDNQNKPQKYKKPKERDQNLPNKNIHSNNSSGKPFPNSSNYLRNQTPYNSSYRGRSPDQKKIT